MFVKIKQNDKTIQVEVNRRECINYWCFSPHRFWHLMRAIDGADNSYQDDHYSCSYRNYHGCPDHPIKIKGERNEKR